MENKNQLWIDRKEYVFNLLKKSNKAGKLKPGATLKIIMFNVMEKYNLTQDETCELIGRVITDYDFTNKKSKEE